MRAKGAMQPLQGGKNKRKENIRGTRRLWETLLAGRKNAANIPKEPSMSSWKVIKAFLKTITNKKVTGMVRQLNPCIKKNHEMKEFQQIINCKRLKSPATPEEELVEMTWSHMRFQQDYKFESYEKGWIHSGGGLTGDQNAPVTLLALDCEMVDCKGGTSELAHVCLVDQSLTTLVDTLVRPSKMVVDYKSKITGLSAEDLKPVTVTQANVQKQVKKWLVPGTILVGHSLHNDLKALKIDHKRVIDTQYIFPVHGRSPLFCLGLRDLCKMVLGYDFRESDKPHVCLDDAKIPMQLVLHRLQHGPSRLEIPSEVDEILLSKLLIHKIPASVTTEDLISLFPNFTCQIEDARKVGQTYSKYTSKYAVFQNKMDANNAFSQLQGFMRADITGRLQKLVFFHPKMHQMYDAKVELFVRKMGFEKHDTEQAATSKLNVKSAETASQLSMISENVAPVIASKKGVEEIAEKVKSRKRKMPRQDYLEAGGMEPLSIEPSSLPVTGHGNKNGVAKTADEVVKPKKVREHKMSLLEDNTVELSTLPDRVDAGNGVAETGKSSTKRKKVNKSRSCVVDHMAVEPLGSSEGLDRHGSDGDTMEPHEKAIDQTLEVVKLKNSRHEDVKDMIPKNEEAAIATHVKVSKVKKKKHSKRKRN